MASPPSVCNSSSHLPPLQQVIEPSGAHEFSVVMLHGMYYTGEMFAQLPALLDEYGGRASSTRFIFPQAPSRSISWPSGSEHGVSALQLLFGTRRHHGAG